MLDEILQERVAPRRGRRNQRAVKRKMTSFPVRDRYADALPAIDISSALRIVKLKFLPQKAEFPL